MCKKKDKSQFAESFIRHLKLEQYYKTDPSDPTKREEFWIDTLKTRNPLGLNNIDAYYQRMFLHFRKSLMFLWENFIFYVEPSFDFFILRYFSSKQVCSFIYLFITYLAYYCTGGQYLGIYYQLLVTFIIYIIIIIIFIATIIITIIELLLLLLLFILLCYFYLFLHRATSSFCSPTTATLVVAWLLLFQLICNSMGIVSLFSNIVSIILEHCFLFIY